jgi:hypothetical protein
MQNMPSIYVLHFEPAFGHARHYIGFTTDPEPDRRVREHLSCSAKGNPLVKAAVKSGSSVTLAHVFSGSGIDRNFERSLKNRADTARWCPCCGNDSRPIPSPSRRRPAFAALAIQSRRSADEAVQHLP